MNDALNGCLQWSEIYQRHHIRELLLISSVITSPMFHLIFDNEIQFKISLFISILGNYSVCVSAL